MNFTSSSKDHLLRVCGDLRTDMAYPVRVRNQSSDVLGKLATTHRAVTVYLKRNIKPNEVKG